MLILVKNISREVALLWAQALLCKQGQEHICFPMSWWSVEAGKPHWSKDIVLALATNCPGDLDSAMADRIDEVLEFPLPGEDERFKLQNLYIDKYRAEAGSRKPGVLQNNFKKQQQQLEIKGLSNDILREAVSKTE
ncbi:hypothetical protein PVK06_049065 [Gossypium arboreum]|uniref:Uncharacterized protein n=1 Tax=Gossypium arboreum TaxID=29729 RepID=A0ABR0MI65_GOSAR|nr:hypothetical protein PVK06_049065 [Gossypium arboreum]